MLGSFERARAGWWAGETHVLPMSRKATVICGRISIHITASVANDKMKKIK